MAKHITISVYIVKETFIHDIVTFAEDIVRKKVASRRILRPKDANHGGGHCKSRESNKDHYNDVALDNNLCKTFTQAFNVTKLSGSVFVNSTILTVFGDYPRQIPCLAVIKILLSKV